MVTRVLDLLEIYTHTHTHLWINYGTKIPKIPSLRAWLLNLQKVSCRMISPLSQSRSSALCTQRCLYGKAASCCKNDPFIFLPCHFQRLPAFIRNAVSCYVVYKLGEWIKKTGFIIGSQESLEMQQVRCSNPSCAKYSHNYKYYFSAHYAVCD